MKIERVTQDKIKVTLTCDEMQRWHLDIEKLSTNAPEAREFFLKVIEQAENELNFNAKDSQLLVEAVVKTDYSVIHISKIRPETDTNKITHKANNSSEDQYCVFKFNSMSDASDACRLISSKFEGCSAFYKMNNSFYILIGFANTTKNQVVSVLSEFGEQDESITIGKLNEYGEILIKENAVTQLAKI